MIENFIASFSVQLVLVLICCISVFVFVMLDLWAGVRKSKRQGLCSVSYGFRKTVEKTAKYYNYVLAFLIIDIIQISLLYSLNISNGYSFWIVPFAVIIGTIFIGFIETKSIFEKEEKKERKKIEESARLMMQLAEMMGSKECLKTIKDKIDVQNNNKRGDREAGADSEEDSRDTTDSSY